MSTQQDRRWWFSVQYFDSSRVRVERFQTQEQAELYAAMTGGLALGPHDLGDLAHDYYLRLSERTK